MGRSLLLCALALAPAAPAAAQSWPDDLFEAQLTAAFHWSGDGPEGSFGVRASWVRLRAPMPMGADFEARYLAVRGVVRLSPSFRLVPDATLRGDACQRTQIVRRRGNDLALGPSFALSAGPVLDLGGGAPLDVGARAGADVSMAIGAAHLRASWLSRHGLEAEIGGGLRLPSIFGDSDVATLCP